MALQDDEERARSVAIDKAKTSPPKGGGEDALERMKEELEQVKKELSRARAKVRATLEMTVDGILVVDGESRITDINQRALAMWQIPPELIDTGDLRTFVEVTSKRVKDHVAYLARIDEISATNPAEAYDSIELLDGRIFERFSAMQGAAGQSEGRVWTFRDITERHRAEEARLLLAAVVDSSDDAIISKTLNGIIRTWNEGARRIFGYSAEEVIGKPITILLPPDRIHEELDILKRLQRGERVNHFETIRVDKQGRLLDISVSISPVRDSRGQVIGASKIARDITERRRFERAASFIAAVSVALAEPNDYVLVLQKIAALAVPSFADWCLVDLQTTGGSTRPIAVMHADPQKAQRARERLLQRPPRSTDRRGPGKVLRVGKSELVADVDAALRLEPPARQDEYLTILRALGIKSYVCVLLRPSAEVSSTLLFGMGESDHRFSSPDLDTAEDLAHRAVIAVENAGLLSALREADRRKDDFLAILAHELRNPLAPIRNSVQLLRDPNSSQEDRKFSVSVMDRQVQQMSRLVDDLLDIARISRGKIELRKERIELATVIEDAVEASRPIVEAQGHQLTVDIPKEPIFIDADPTRIAQVLSNLLSNAAKYTNAGGRIWVTAGEVQGEAVIRVLDTGVGIPEGMLTRIFDMFTQVEQSMEGGRSGLGIGLTLVQRLVEMHGGTIRVFSPGIDKGSEFVVRLPLAGGAPVPIATSSNREERARPAIGQRVLVVDDNRDGAESLALLLRRIGHVVEIAHDGPAAIVATEQFDPRVILLDIGLPKMNGFEVAVRIREQRADRVVLVAVTGWGQSEDRRRTREAGFDYHMTKPVDFGVLRDLLSGLG